MSTLRRILKYTPAVVLGLLVIAWVVSWFNSVRYFPQLAGYDGLTALSGGSFVVGWVETGRIGGYVPGFGFSSFRRALTPGRVTGRAKLHRDDWQGMGHVVVYVPIPWVLTGLLPLAVGSITGFRFRLSHYLAYTTLVAVELAYYLRWQE